MADQRLYDRLGGHAAIRAVVDDFYDRLLANPELGPFFEDADLEYLRRTQTDFLCEAAGGPEIYEGPSVRDAHLDVPFEPEHVEQAVELLYESLDEFDVDGEDAEAVVGAVAQYEADLLAAPEND